MRPQGKSPHLGVVNLPTVPSHCEPSQRSARCGPETGSALCQAALRPLLLRLGSLALGVAALWLGRPRTGPCAVLLRFACFLLGLLEGSLG